MFRAKMQVNTVTDDGHSDILKMTPVTGGTPEDNSFSKYTPAGELSLSISNPNLRGKIKPRDLFYVDFTPVNPTV